jgi:hypothetical protein
VIKKLCVTGAVLASAAAISLLAAPAHADSWDNWSRNSESAQSGNLFGRVIANARGQGTSANVNNINGTVANADDNVLVRYDFD